MTDVTSVYDRFTELAKRALVASRDAAASLGHDFIGTEHLLLGLAQTAGTASEVLRAQSLELGQIRAEVVRQSATDVATPGGEAAKDALSTLGIDVAEIRRRADETFGPGAFNYPRPAYSLHVKRVLKASLQETIGMGQQRMDTEHLLLGLLAENDGVGIKVLTALGVDPNTLRRSVFERTA